MTSTTRDRRALKFLGLGLIVVVAGYLLFFAGNKTGTGARSGSAGTNAAPLGETPLSARSPFLIFSGRDPFIPLVGASNPAPQPTVSPAGSPNPSPGGGSSASVGGHTVVLDSIFTINGQQKVQVEVDGHVYTVAIGGSFAGNFKLTSISGSCASFTYNSQPFSLCLSQNK
jgi:hypothetical protein